MRLALLWTDKCLLLVFLIGMLWIAMSLRKGDMRRSFTYLLYQPIAVGSGIILLFFLLIGGLDSIRFQSAAHANAPETVLDWILSPIGELDEGSYSKPFALTQFTSETLLVKNKVTQVYPRLAYPPQQIKTEAQKWHFIQQIIAKSFLVSLLGVLVLGGCGVLLSSFRLLPRSIIVTAFITLFVCVFFVVASFWLSRYFHVLGTGKIGQDLFYETLKSIRTGLVIGLLTTLFMLPLALFLGVAAGYFGGMVDDVIQYIYTTLSSIPGVLLITASVLSMQTYIANHPERFTSLAASADARLLALCLILGVTSWTSLCRLLRAETLKLREMDFVLAARALGSNAWQIMLKHLLPNVMPIVVITLVLDFSYLVLAESVLSYVGVGVSPLTISWGNMINAARLELAREPVVWWPMMAAFTFMFVLVLASNLFADAVRDAFDPHH